MEPRPGADARHVGEPLTTPSELAVHPISGLGEMGAHHMVVDVGADAFLVDCGVLFPAPWDVGVDHFAPAFDPAVERAASGRLRGLLLTHGHRDHIGAVGHLLTQLPDLPVYGTPFTVALLRSLLQDRAANAHVVTPGDPLRLGETTCTWYGVTHSIPGACSLAMEGEAGTVIHSGDFRVQEHPFLGPPTDVEGLRALGDRGVDLALVDSTGSAQPGRTAAETDVADALATALARVEGLAVVTLFSSHVERVAACIRAARLTGRTPALYGRSLERTVSIARDLGLFGTWGDALRDIDDVAHLGSRGLVIATGTQGEPRAPVARMARGEDSRVSLSSGDAVLWSARAIPGNDRSIGLVVNRLIDRGVTVIPPWGPAGRGLHASGHARRDEVREWLSWVRPRVILPIHGEAWHLAEHARAIDEDAQVVSLRSGDSLALRDGRPTIERGVAQPPHAAVGRELWRPTEPALRERRRIARTGVVTATIVGHTVHVVSVGVFPEASRAAAEGELEATARAALEGAVEDPRETVRLTLRRAMKRRTGDRVECVVRDSSPKSGKQRLY